MVSGGTQLHRIACTFQATETEAETFEMEAIHPAIPAALAELCERIGAVVAQIK